MLRLKWEFTENAHQAAPASPFKVTLPDNAYVPKFLACVGARLLPRTLPVRAIRHRWLGRWRFSNYFAQADSDGDWMVHPAGAHMIEMVRVCSFAPLRRGADAR